MFSRIIALSICCLFALSSGTRAAEFADEKGTIPIAAWDIVPYQIITTLFKAGVVAFHEKSTKVDFTVTAAGKNILRAQVNTPKLNDRTNVWEYFITIDPATIPDGPLHINATCTPGGAGNRAIKLPRMTLYANSKGSLKFKSVFADSAKGNDANTGTKDKPMRTLAAAVIKAGDGGTVFLMPGDYSPDKIKAGKRDYWTTIQPAKGIKRDDVRIGKGRPGADKLLLNNICLAGNFDTGKYNAILTGENEKNIIWLDNCKVYNKHGRWKGYVACFANKYVGYVTGGICTEMQRAPGAVLMRDYRIEKIAEDVFTDSKTAINCSVDGVDAGKTGGHSDFHQSYSPSGFTSGVILYNCRGVNCASQGFFGSNLKDSAFVNCLFVKTPNNSLVSQYSGKLDHILFFHLTVPNQKWVWRDGLKTRNCFIVNSIIKKMSAYSNNKADLSGLTISFNHFIDKNNCDNGMNETTGSAEFVNPPKGDYNLKTTSPAFHTGRNLQTVPSDINGKKWDSKSPNRGAFAN